MSCVVFANYDLIKASDFYYNGSFSHFKKFSKYISNRDERLIQLSSISLGSMNIA